MGQDDGYDVRRFDATEAKQKTEAAPATHLVATCCATHGATFASASNF